MYNLSDLADQLLVSVLNTSTLIAALGQIQDELYGPLHYGEDEMSDLRQWEQVFMDELECRN